eukprot:NODE_6087_length_1707_cov_4.876582.p1 GENE.NODE_6087_length_1707_cov_4.876582~~NODE_6087_length_1707_cov_4.876582.p1  ORF type:complete len:468 (+),score=78.57 NODE_6087_length_1707_cov_4.876582:152-1405(+)
MAIPLEDNAINAEILANFKVPGLAGSVMLMCCTLGSFLGGFLVDWPGRNVSIIIGLVGYALTAPACTIVSSPIAFLVLLGVSGVFLGVIDGIVSIYIFELVPHNIVGPLLMGFLMATVAAMLLGTLGFIVVMPNTVDGPWRSHYLWCLMCWVPEAMLCFLLFTPTQCEPPSYLALQGRDAELLEVLSLMSGADCQDTPRFTAVRPGFALHEENNMFQRRLAPVLNCPSSAQLFAMAVYISASQFLVGGIGVCAGHFGSGETNSTPGVEIAAGDELNIVALLMSALLLAPGVLFGMLVMKALSRRASLAIFAGAVIAGGTLCNVFGTSVLGVVGGMVILFNMASSGPAGFTVLSELLPMESRSVVSAGIRTISQIFLASAPLVATSSPAIFMTVTLVGLLLGTVLVLALVPETKDSAI